MRSRVRRTAHYAWRRWVRRQKRKPVPLICLAAALVLAPIVVVAAVRFAETATAPVPSPPPGRVWRHIVIHHSASDGGNAETFDAMHKARGWQGLGYHFVIDNGNGGPDGNLEIGWRWEQQAAGAHTGGTPHGEYNAHGIGICLVGNFVKHSPSPAQLAELNRLVDELVRRYRIPPERIIGHRDAPNAKTECPGDMLWAYVHGPLRDRIAGEYAGQ
ncbi:MAG: peptidoglycan recognition family protein [Phycisphaerae bacterium]